MRTALFCIMLLGLALGSIEDLTAAETVSSAASEANRANVALGKRMYRDGILPSGQLMSATVLGDVPLTGAQLACANCHRRSGLGSTEVDGAITISVFDCVLHD